MQLALSYAGGTDDKTLLTIKKRVIGGFYFIIRTMLVRTVVPAENFLFFNSRITKVIEVIKKVVIHAGGHAKELPAVLKMFRERWGGG